MEGKDRVVSGRHSECKAATTSGGMGDGMLKQVLSDRGLTVSLRSYVTIVHDRPRSKTQLNIVQLTKRIAGHI